MRWSIILISVIIGVGSIFYTTNLATELKAREQGLIKLYADALEYAVNNNADENLSFNWQIIENNNSIPVIVTDGYNEPINHKNIDFREGADEEEQARVLKKELALMKATYDPIPITLLNTDGSIYDVNFIYYRNSYLLTSLEYYPYVQLSVILIFGLLAFLAFNHSKIAEQNRVWVGLAKETAHQLGTPLSSLMAWVEYLKNSPMADENKEVIEELGKDIYKLEMITARFSNIGSIPVIKDENVIEAIEETVNYLRPRIRSQGRMQVHSDTRELTAKMNKPLFDWVIENICKNAVDAMKGVGKIDIYIIKESEQFVIVDVTDNGKGIAKNKLKQVFQPGYTTKTRGWGLGLTLVKRIIENYHNGRIFVKSSDPGVATTFRIILRG